MAPEAETTILPSPCLVVLAGPAGAGKSTWAQEQFTEGIVSSDSLRALVGEGEDDFRASTAAFAMLDKVVTARLGRGLSTVIDTLGMDHEARERWRGQAHRVGMATAIVVFETPSSELRRRNSEREKRVPADVLRRQLSTWEREIDTIVAEPFDHVIRVSATTPTSIRRVPAQFTVREKPIAHPDRQPDTAPRARSHGLRFGLHISSFDFPGGREELGARLAEIGPAAEAAGFESIWVMDHFRQIPQVGPDWSDMLESWSTISYLAACTTTARIGVLVSGVTHRSVPLLGKIVATVDVLSGGRVVCGLGAGWYEREHLAYGWPFPTDAARLDLLEDALRFLPLLWGKGAPPFEGRVLKVPEAIGYPRPLQDPVPIIVGGGGERRTLRLVAEFAGGCNLFGSPEQVAAKLGVLRRHAEDVEREVGEIEVTHLSTALTARSPAELEHRLTERRPRRMGQERFAASVGAGVVDDQIERYRQLAAVGVQTAIVRLADLGTTDPLDEFSTVISAFE